MTVIYATHPSQSGNWYDPKTCQQVESVIGKTTGKPRKPNIKDARANGWYPGVTTIIKVIDKPQLTRWKIEQAIMSSLTLTRQTYEPDDAWVTRIIEDSEEQAQKAAEAGTGLHKLIETLFRGEPWHPLFNTSSLPAQTATATYDHLRAVCGDDGWLAEKVCVSPLGYGTKADLCNMRWVLDFKTKDGNQEALDKLETYKDHWRQLAATRNALGVGYETARCGIVFVSRTDVACRLVEIEEPKLVKGLKTFKTLLQYWREDNDFEEAA